MAAKKTTNNKRKKWTAEEKMNILRDHFSRSKIIETSEQHRVHPNMISNWWKTVVEAGKDALSGSKHRKQAQREKTIQNYEEELSQKNEVIAELSRELLELKKKSNGNR